MIKTNLKIYLNFELQYARFAAVIADCDERGHPTHYAAPLIMEPVDEESRHVMVNNTFSFDKDGNLGPNSLPSEIFYVPETGLNLGLLLGIMFILWRKSKR